MEQGQETGVKANLSNKKGRAELTWLLTSGGVSVASSSFFLYLEQAIELGVEVPFAFIVELKPISLRHGFLT